MQTTLHRKRMTAAPCPRCHEHVRTLVLASSGHLIEVDAERVVGGLYALDEHGRARRRGLVELSNEYGGRGPAPGGFNVHECQVVAEVDRFFGG
jgi:hypothetical protein